MTKPSPITLSRSQVDGSLLTAPLRSVVVGAMDALYDDLQTMSSGGEIPILTTGDTNEGSTPSGTPQPSGTYKSAAPPSVRRDNLANLSFAQRRHELSIRVYRHSSAIQHVTALVSAYSGVTDDTLESLLGRTTAECSEALKTVYTKTMGADEAQDALYFHHAELWKARRHVHDVRGAIDVLTGKGWLDLPTDIQLLVDKYAESEERHWGRDETRRRLQSCVRRKLLLGEVGQARKLQLMGQSSPRVPWKVTLEKGACAVRLSFGKSKGEWSQVHDEETPIYPLEARVTVLSEDTHAPWTLLSIDVTAQPKTGESSHQLDPNNRQRFDLHRLCAQAMTMAEQEFKATLEQDNNEDDEDDEGESKAKRAKTETNNSLLCSTPLDRLFEVAHTFCISLQLEMLSAQAEALKRGAWGIGDGNSRGMNVSPIRYLDSGPVHAYMALHFWSCDDRFGGPKIRDLALPDGQTPETNPLDFVKPDGKESQRLSLYIRAVPRVGLIVSLPGAEAAMQILATKNQSADLAYLERNISKLQGAVHNPFSLSAADAILAATALCVHFKCVAVVEALQGCLPPWMALDVEAGTLTISISCDDRPSVAVLRTLCDTRTGKFVPLFPPAMRLLKALACHDLAVSTVARMQASALASANPMKRRAMGALGKDLTGRIVKDAFDGLVRSMDTLSDKAGVGASQWEVDAKLRAKTVELACSDVKRSLIVCCGMAAVYGLAAEAMTVACGVDAIVDM